MTFVLDPEQEADAQRIAAEPSGAAGDFSTMSAGKTAVAVRVAQLRGVETLLIIAPLGTRPGWKKHLEDLGVDLPFRHIQNSKPGKEAMSLLQFGEPGAYFIGPEYMNTFAWTDTGKRNGSGRRIKAKRKFWELIHIDMVVVDEVHRGTANTGSDRYKVYSQLRTDFALALSGTPAGNRFDGLYGVTKFLWPGVVAENKEDWKRRWCETEYDHWSYDHMKVVGEKNPGEYLNWLPCVVRREWKYDGTVDESNVYVELSAQQRKAYTELERNMVTIIEGDPLVIEFPQSLRIRLREASLGMFSIMEDGSVGYAEGCKSTKLDALKDVLEFDFGGESALVLTSSKKFAKVTVARLNSWGYRAVEYSGDVSAAAREEIREKFARGEVTHVVLIIKAGGTGIDNLQSATRNVVWLSVDDSRIENAQAAARVIRRGQGDLVRVRHIVALGTYDEGILSKQVADAIAMNKSMKLEGGK